MVFNNTRYLVLSHEHLHNHSRTGREGSEWRKTEARRDWGDCCRWYCGGGGYVSFHCLPIHHGSVYRCGGWQLALKRTRPSNRDPSTQPSVIPPAGSELSVTFSRASSPPLSKTPNKHLDTCLMQKCICLLGFCRSIRKGELLGLFVSHPIHFEGFCLFLKSGCQTEKKEAQKLQTSVCLPLMCTQTHTHLETVEDWWKV